jgi:hypothetical protein
MPSSNSVRSIASFCRLFALKVGCVPLVLDKFIQRKRKDYNDPNSRQNMSKLNSDLSDIHSIMKQNIQEVLNRGEKLDRE